MGNEAVKKYSVDRVFLFLAGQSISLFGSSVVQFSILWYITDVTNSGVYVMLSTVCSFLPQLIISLFAGVWADRYNRKKLIVWADGGIAFSTFVLALLMMFGVRHISLILIISIIRSFGAGIQTPAVNATLPQLVPDDKLMKVNSVNGSVQAVINILAPAVSAVVLSTGKIYNVLFIDVLTALVGIGILLAIRIPVHKKASELSEPSGYFTDLKEGIAYLRNSYFLKNLMIIYIVFTILIVPACFLNTLMVKRVFAEQFGDLYKCLTISEISFFAGAIAGGLGLSAWGGFKNRLITMGIGTTAFGISTVFIGMSNVFLVFLVMMFLNGITFPVINTPVTVLLQEKVDKDIQGRVFSMASMIFSAFMPLGMLIFGPLADVFSIQAIMIFSGVSMTAVTLSLFRHKKFLAEGNTHIE